MPISVKCQCGRGIKVRDSAAGKRVKCPACGKPVRIPEPEAEFDDYGEADDGYGDDPYTEAPAPKPRRKSGGKKSKAKKSSGGVPTPVLIIGGIVVGTLLIGGALYAVLSGGSGDSNIAATDPGTGSTAITDVANSSAGTTPQPDGHAAPNAGTGSVADAGHGADGGHDASAANTTPVTPAASSPPRSASSSDGTLWVVLSDFKERPNPGSIGKTYQVSYRVVSGKSDPAQSYVIYIGTSMGVMERYSEVDVIPESTGTIPLPAGLGVSGAVKAYMAIKKGRQDWQAVSGVIELGGAATTDQRPLTVQEAAGAGAQGKMLALANARFEKSRIGGNALVVDFVLQQPVDPSKTYYLIIQGSGSDSNPIVSSVTSSLLRAKQGETDQFGVSLIGPGEFPAGPLRATVEARVNRRETGEAVSNTATLQR